MTTYDYSSEDMVLPRPRSGWRWALGALALVAGFVATTAAIGLAAAPAPVTSESRWATPSELPAVLRAAQSQLRDPASAELVGRVVLSPGGVACGLISSRNGFGGMSGPVPFVVWPSLGSGLVASAVSAGDQRHIARLCGRDIRPGASAELAELRQRLLSVPE